MLKSILAALVALWILSLTALAAPRCGPFTVAGSYVRHNNLTPYIDQLTLSIDGTAYWFSSSSFGRMILWVLGSWVFECARPRELLVTRLHIREFDPYSQIYLNGHLSAS
jgi:hypothetical protein